MNATIRCVARTEVAGDPVVDMELSTTLPFVPQAGMHLAFNEGEYFEVEGVYWSSVRPNEIEVCTVEPDRDDRLPRASELLALGWVES